MLNCNKLFCAKLFANYYAKKLHDDYICSPEGPCKEEIFHVFIDDFQPSTKFQLETISCKQEKKEEERRLR